MNEKLKRITGAFAHKENDRTPLFELFWPFHPIYWDICGQTVGTNQAMRWNALADGISPEELIKADAEAIFKMAKYFELDMLRVTPKGKRHFERPAKKDKNKWSLNGMDYKWDERIKLVVPDNPDGGKGFSTIEDEESARIVAESFDPNTPPNVPDDTFAVFEEIKKMAAKENIDFVYMAEVPAGTAVAGYQSFIWIWMLEEPELYLKWLGKQSSFGKAVMEEYIKRGIKVIALGGDISCDKGPIISPALYRELVLPTIKDFVNMVHEHDAYAVYTSDGNHWPIKNEFFYESNIDGYKEVDKAAGMTFERLIEEGIDRDVCIIGNIDARHTMCHGTPDKIRNEVINCLNLGRKSPGGHILHTSHSVHEDVPKENYYTMVNTYREYFGMPPLKVFGGKPAI
jgi:hypothetical protein